MTTYNQLRLRIHEILTYAVNQMGFDMCFDKTYQASRYTGSSVYTGLHMMTEFGKIDLTFHFGDIDLHISTDKSPSFFVRSTLGTYPIQRVKLWPTPDNPNQIITDDGLILPMMVTEYEQYLKRLLEELSSDRCFEWIDRLQTNGTEL